MSGSPKEKLHTQGAEEVSEERELYLRDGRKLVVGERAGEQLVEIRSESGMLEIRILLTEQGPVLQMESARLSLKATESVEIESKQVAIKATENIDVQAAGDVVVVGATIHLNPDK
jgi:phage gp45-like